MARNFSRVGAVLGALVAATLTVSAQESSNKPQKVAPLKPGGLRITVRNPLPGNWVCTKAACFCKQLACGAVVRVTYSTRPTPARKPDPQALERFAKIDVPKQMQALNAAQGVLSDGKQKIELLGTRVTRVLGRPAVDVEAKVVTDKNVVHSVSDMIFAGPVLLTVTSMSTDRVAARKGLSAYVGAMTLVEGPSIAPKHAPEPNGAPDESPETPERPDAPVSTPPA